MAAYPIATTFHAFAFVASIISVHYIYIPQYITIIAMYMHVITDRHQAPIHAASICRRT